jgi:hypothetical protein
MKSSEDGFWATCINRTKAMTRDGVSEVLVSAKLWRQQSSGVGEALVSANL